MSTASLMRLEHLFKLQTFDVGGKYLFREGEPATHVIIVKDGDFVIEKRDLYQTDQALIEFLNKSVVRSRMAKKILLLRGGQSIYSKSK